MLHMWCPFNTLPVFFSSSVSVSTSSFAIFFLLPHLSTPSSADPPHLSPATLHPHPFNDNMSHYKRSCPAVFFCFSQMEFTRHTHPLPSTCILPPLNNDNNNCLTFFSLTLLFFCPNLVLLLEPHAPIAWAGVVASSNVSVRAPQL